MKKFLIIFAIIAIASTGFFIHVIWTAYADKTVHHQEMRNVVQQETGMVVTEVERFHAEEAYDVYTALDDDGNSHYIFATDRQLVHMLPAEDIKLPREEAAEQAVRDYPELRRISRINPAYTEDVFAWEVVTYDEDNQLQYIYYDMQDGTFLKRFVVG
jgi:uncharacterized protein YpmB